MFKLKPRQLPQVGEKYRWAPDAPFAKPLVATVLDVKDGYIQYEIGDGKYKTYMPLSTFLDTYKEKV